MIPEMKPVKSSNVEAIGHHGTELHVRFRGKNPMHYVYEGVSAEMHAKLLGADSIGKFMADHVRGKFKTRKHDAAAHTG